MAKLNLTKLIAQKNALEKQIADAQRAHRGDAIARVKAMMAEFGVTLADLGGPAAANGAAAPAPGPVARKTADAKPGKAPKAPKAPGANAGKKVAAKYRNNATGDSWSGRGLKPKWLTAALASGRDISEFTI